MSSLENIKVLAAVLVAGTIAMLAGFVAHLAVHPEPLAQQAYPVEGVTSAEAPAAETPVAEAPAAEAREPESVLPLLAAADPAAGQKVARKCTSCHSFDEGGPNKIGPNLWDVVGRAVASVDGYSYSSAMQDKSGERWTYENLGAFLTRPRDWAPGTKMTFAGLKKTEERADLVAYLRSLSDSPAPLPE